MSCLANRYMRNAFSRLATHIPQLSRIELNHINQVTCNNDISEICSPYETGVPSSCRVSSSTVRWEGFEHRPFINVLRHISLFELVNQTNRIHYIILEFLEIILCLRLKLRHFRIVNTKSKTYNTFFFSQVSNFNTQLRD